MLEIKNITFAYGENKVLKDINLDLKPGMVHGLLGPNGSGKTTLFEVIAGRLNKQQGTILFEGVPPSSQQIGYLQTQPYFYSLITGREYLKLHWYQNKTFQIEKWNNIFELPLNDLIESYSSGMKKKLAVMGMLCLDRPIMLLDEPFNNLDIEANQFLVELVGMLAEKGKTIFLSSHFLEVITKVSDRIRVLENGIITDTVAKDDINKWSAQYRSSKIKESTDRARGLL